MPVKLNDREYRAMTMTAVEDGDYKVRGYATTFDDPYVLYEDKDMVLREIIDHDALKDADMSDVIMQYDHEGRVYARTSNNTLTVTPDAHGLGMEADLGGTDLGRGLFQEIKGGYTTKMSWGFTVNRDRDEWTSETAPDGRALETRTIKSVRKVYDVSAVSLPANDATEISARNLADGVIERVKAERLEAMKVEERRNALKEWFK
jgi:hypothetical protein